MAFTGKATYSAGATLPDVAEDVSDIVSVVSPYETALLDHLRALAVDGGGWSVRGSFGRDPRRPDADGVRQALAGLGRLLLAEPERELAVHRERLLAALGPNAGLVAGVPDLAAVLGVSAEPPDGDPDTVQDRLCRAFAGVLAAVASSRGPVVLVLDDLVTHQYHRSNLRLCLCRIIRIFYLLDLCFHTGWHQFLDESDPGQTHHRLRILHMTNSPHPIAN